MNEVTIFMNVIVALVLGMILGAERTFAGKNAGMRTYGLVAMGSCLLVVISQVVLSMTPGAFDPLRLAAGIVMGIGFLGAGLIVVKDSTPSGLTTAAGLWVASGIGIAVGYGLYNVAMFATFLTYLVFTFLWSLERKLKAIADYNTDDQDKLKNS